jgi:hypothetical protein
VIVAAHGIRIELPAGWEGRIYRRPGGDPTLHAASFPLPRHDGDFATGAAAGMPPGGTLLVLTEYRPGAGLEPGRGLYAPDSLPLPLARAHFSPRALIVAHPGQAGLQHFFTARGRPFCLYAVIRRAAAGQRWATAADARGLAALNGALRSVEIASRG